MTDLLVPVLLVEAGLLLACLVALVAHMAWAAARARRVAARLAAAEHAAVRALAVGNPDLAVAEVSAVPAREALALLVRLADAVTGQASATVTAIARRSGLLARVERRLRSVSRWRRLRAVRLLTRLGGGEDTVPGLLEDRAPQVRAQAASWVVRHGDDAAVAALVARLVDADRLARFAAADGAVRLGSRAAPALATVIARTEGPAVVPALTVAAALNEAPLLAGAVRPHAGARDPEVRAAAVRALARMAGAAEEEVVAAALDDEDPRVRAEAAEACGRTGLWQIAPRLGALLRDPSWDVRRAAGLALRGLGGPGSLVLRRSLDDEDRFAADMARLVLDEERVG